MLRAEDYEISIAVDGDGLLRKGTFNCWVMEAYIRSVVLSLDLPCLCAINADADPGEQSLTLDEIAFRGFASALVACMYGQVSEKTTNRISFQDPPIHWGTLMSWSSM